MDHFDLVRLDMKSTKKSLPSFESTWDMLCYTSATCRPFLYVMVYGRIAVAFKRTDMDQHWRKKAKLQMLELHNHSDSVKTIGCEIQTLTNPDCRYRYLHYSYETLQGHVWSSLYINMHFIGELQNGMTDTTVWLFSGKILPQLIHSLLHQHCTAQTSY